MLEIYRYEGGNIHAKIGKSEGWVQTTNQGIYWEITCKRFEFLRTTQKDKYALINGELDPLIMHVTNDMGLTILIDVKLIQGRVKDKNVFECNEVFEAKFVAYSYFHVDIE